MRRGTHPYFKLQPSSASRRYSVTPVVLNLDLTISCLVGTNFTSWKRWNSSIMYVVLSLKWNSWPTLQVFWIASSFHNCRIWEEKAWSQKVVRGFSACSATVARNELAIGCNSADSSQRRSWACSMSSFMDSTMLLKMTSLQWANSSGEKTWLWIIRNCFTIVDFPASPAPISRNDD